MNDNEILNQAKIQGFSQAVSNQKYLNTDMPLKKQMFIQDTAEIVFIKMVNNNISFDNDVKQCEYIKEVLDAVSMNISEEESEEVFELIFDTLNSMIKYVLSNYK